MIGQPVIAALEALVALFANTSAGILWVAPLVLWIDRNPSDE
jgi:hypothetical protein